MKRDRDCLYFRLVIASVVVILLAIFIAEAIEHDCWGVV